MNYTLYFTDEAKKDLAGLKKNEPAAFKKAKALLTELQQHPKQEPENRSHLVMDIRGSFPEELPKSTGLYIPSMMKE